MPHRPTHIAPTCPTSTNANGRLLRVDDGTGYQIFSYDRPGISRKIFAPLHRKTPNEMNTLPAYTDKEKDTETGYFFHSDHLGSANWVTTATASPAQFLLHQPYGEEFVIQWRGSYDERFTFTGKERDAETGYYYFGARFDNVDLGFMSVDPMSDKYPSISPYAYCAWNPVKLVDPEGMFPFTTHANMVWKASAGLEISMINRKKCVMGRVFSRILCIRI